MTAIRQFDARIVRKNESAKGLFITLEIAGDDYYGGVSEFRPGSLLRIRYEELDSETGEQASSGDGESQPRDHSPGKSAAPQGGEETAAPHKERRRFADMLPSTQCALRCADKRFWQMWRDKTGRIVETEEQMAAIIRKECGIESRAELDRDGPAARWWRGHEEQFQRWLTTQQHGGLVR